MKSESGEELTELEDIEVNRRLDELNAIVSSASKLLERKCSIEEIAQEERERLSSKWYLIIGILGLVLYFYLKSPSSKLDLNFGSIVFVAVICDYLNSLHTLNRNTTSISKVNEKLFELEHKWIANVGAPTFWELRNFVINSYFDDSEEKFMKWRDEQRWSIIILVCGWSRGGKIVEYEKRLLNELNRESLLLDGVN